MSFIDFARAHGVDIDQSKFFASDKIRRTGTVEKPRSNNGAFFWDGQRGWVMDWSGDARVMWYEDPNAKPWTDQEKRDWALKRQTANADKDRSYELAAERAMITLRNAKPDTHPYLHIKGFPEEKMLVLDDKLLIPMRNVVTNKIQGYQSIYWDAPNMKYEKKMLPGMRAKNAVLYMGARDASEVWLVEGYATGLSVRDALRSTGSIASVVVCFSASNMIQVADQIKGSRYIFADNDVSETGAKSAQATGLPWTMADEVGWDANDLHKKHGLFAVAKKIMDLRKKVLTGVETTAV
jgi:putative DNA primase/helicase